MSYVSLDLPIGSIGDLAVPTSTQTYDLGRTINVKDTSTNVICQFMYVKSHTTLTVYQPYVVLNLGTAGSEWVTGAPITLASAAAIVCVPQVAFTSGYYGWVLIKGRGTALTGAVTATHAMQLYTSGSSFITTGAITNTINSCAWAIATTTASGANTVMLSGKQVEIQTT